MNNHLPHNPAGRGVCLLLTAVLLSLCLLSFAACSDQVYDPTQDTLILNEGSGKVTGNGNFELPTEPPTGSVIEIPNADPFENSPHVLRADFLDTGNSDAILIRMDDTIILMDTGESDDYPAISRKLTEYGITEIDYLIISHYDNDHIGTMSQILQHYTVKNVYMPDYVRDSSLYRRMMTALDATQGVTVHRPTEDVRIDLPYGSLWINPTGLYEPGAVLGSDDAHALEENNYSLITSIYFGDISILLAGDAEQDRITEFMGLLSEGDTYDVIKIPHHGGYDKALGELLRKSKGVVRYCVVHAGDKSLVEASLVTAMRTSGAAAKFTYDGDIAFSTDGTSMTVNQN
ncbi:MAG: MBL fold metallo-hydrolase [Clostridia bacterium]|nr:MBL fold metallo-hydrolase [Clostridia bacterium]